MPNLPSLLPPVYATLGIRPFLKSSQPTNARPKYRPAVESSEMNPNAVLAVSYCDDDSNAVTTWTLMARMMLFARACKKSEGVTTVSVRKIVYVPVSSHGIIHFPQGKQKNCTFVRSLANTVQLSKTASSAALVYMR